MGVTASSARPRRALSVRVVFWGSYVALYHADRVVCRSRFGAAARAPLLRLSPKRSGAVMSGLEPGP